MSAATDAIGLYVFIDNQYEPAVRTLLSFIKITGCFSGSR